MNFKFAVVAFVLGSVANAGTLNPKDIELRSYIESEDGKYVILTLEENAKTNNAMGGYPHAVFWGPKGGPYQQMLTNTEPRQKNYHSFNKVEYIGGGNWQPYFAFKNPKDDQVVEFKHHDGKSYAGYTEEGKFSMSCGGQELNFVRRKSMDKDKAAVQKQLQSGEAELNYLRPDARETVAALRTKPDAKGNSTYFFIDKSQREGHSGTFKIYSGVPGNMQDKTENVSWVTDVEPRKQSVSMKDGYVTYEAAEGPSFQKMIEGKVGEKIPLEKISKAEYALLGVPGAGEFDSTPCDLAENGLDSSLLFNASTECIADGLRLGGKNVSPKYVALVSMYLKRENKFTAAEFTKFVNENGYCQTSVYGGIRKDQEADFKNFLKASNNLSNQSHRFNQIFGVNPATVTSLEKMSSGALLASASMDAGLIKNGKEPTHFTACSQQMHDTRKDDKLVSALEKSCKLNTPAAKPALTSDSETKQ